MPKSLKQVFLLFNSMPAIRLAPSKLKLVSSGFLIYWLSFPQSCLSCYFSQPSCCLPLHMSLRLCNNVQTRRASHSLSERIFSLFEIVKITAFGQQNSWIMVAFPNIGNVNSSTLTLDHFVTVLQRKSKQQPCCPAVRFKQGVQNDHQTYLWKRWKRWEQIRLAIARLMGRFF